MSRRSGQAPRWESSTGALVAGFCEKVALVRRLEFELLGDLAELNGRGAAAELGFSSPEALVMDAAHVGRGEARRWVRRAMVLHGSVGVSGAAVDAALPATAEAVAEGAVSVQHVDVIADFHDSLPAEVDPGMWTSAEALLADHARRMPPRGLTRAVEELRARLDPDGNLPTDRSLAEPDRALRTAWLGDQFRIAGEFDREAGMLLEAALSPLTAPVDADDSRSTEQRRGDALVDLVSLAVDTGRVRGEGGAAVTVMVTMDEGNLREQLGSATTMDAHRLPAAQVRRMACDAGIIPALLGRRGETLDTASRARTAPTAVRHRLTLRDRGCAFPGCHKPPAHTQAHHITHWADGGLSTPDNMVLLCSHHHRTIHHTDWQVRIRTDMPEFIPPAYLDPQQQPRSQPRLSELENPRRLDHAS